MRRGALLVGHLENISWRVLEAYPVVVRELIRRRHGVYALYNKNRLYYVGLASDLRNRLKHHLKDHHRGAQWAGAGPAVLKLADRIGALILTTLLTKTF